MTTTAAIEIAGLTKSYGAHAVLQGVDVRIPSGTVFALLGSNGAGKTTVVKILSTLLRADGGTAAVNGYDVTTNPSKVRASISLTGQFAAVDEILTGRENLLLVAHFDTSMIRAGLRPTCWPNSICSTRPGAGWRPIRVACAAAWTLR